MAAAVRTSAVGGSSSGTGDRTATITPASGDLLVVYCCVAANSNDTPTCSDNNGSGTYDLIDVMNFAIASVNYRMSVFVRTALMANTTSTVVTVATGSNSSGAVHVLAITGVTRTGTSAVRSKGSQNNQAAATAAPTLNQSALSANATLVAHGSADTTTTPPTNWTEIQDTNFANDTVALETAFRASGFTGTTITFGAASSTQFCSHALELDISVPLTQSASDDVNNLVDARELGYGNLHSDSVANLADTVVIVMGHALPFSDSVNNLADGTAKVIGTWSASADSLQSLTDALLKLLSYELALADSEAANWADAHQLLLAQFLALSDNNLVSDAAILVLEQREIFTDSFTLIDAATITTGIEVYSDDSLDLFSDSTSLGYGLELTDATDTSSIPRPNILFAEAGGASTEGAHLYDSIGGVPTVDISIKPPSAYSSIKCDIGQWVRKGGTSNVLLNNAARISFYFYVESLTSGPGNILLVEDSSASPDPTLDIRLDSDGLLAFHPVDGSTETVGTHVLSPGTWYRISVSFNENSTVDSLDTKVYLDGVEDISVTAQSTNSLHGGVFRLLGPNTLDGGPSHFAHVYVDDGSDLTDTGDVRCTAKFPTTVNQDDFDTTGGTGAVNERPLDEANYREQAGSSQVYQTYNLQSESDGDVDITGATILGFMGWAHVKKSSPLGGGGSPRLTIDGVDYVINPTTTPSIFTKSITQPTYPSSTAAIGMRSMGNTVDTYLYECGVVVAYTRSSSGLVDSLDYELSTGPSLSLSLSDTVALTDSITIGYGLLPTETLDSLTDAFVLRGDGLATFSDLFTLTDSESHTLGLSLEFAESISLADSLTLGHGLVIIDSCSWNDSLALGHGLLCTDAISLTDTTVVQEEYLLSFSDTLTLTDSESRVLELRLTFSEAISITDSIVLGHGLSFGEQIVLTDALALRLDQQLTFMDSLALNDEAALQLGHLLDFTDSLTLTDDYSSILGYQKSFSDTLATFADVESAVLGYLLSLADTTPTLTDASTHVLDEQLNLSDLLALTDSLNLGYGLLVNDDTNSLTDFLATNAVQGPLRQVGVTDSVDNLADSIAIRLDYELSVADLLNVTDSTQVVEGLLTSSSDTLSLTDSTTSTLGHLVPLVDSLTINDSIQLRLGYELTTSDSLALTDTALVNLNYQLAFSDNVSLLADSLAKSLGLGLIIADNRPTFTDTLDLFSAGLLQLTETLTLTDSLTKFGAGFLACTDSLLLTDNVTIDLRGPDLDETLSDSLVLTDTISLTLDNELRLQLLTFDSLTLTDHYFDLRHPYPSSPKRHIVVSSAPRVTVVPAREVARVPVGNRVTTVPAREVTVIPATDRTTRIE